ncbi:hypothetical protein J31TS4_19320 [Paenibacillus sp. J31TS4]|nr:hypothetical protein J31TS4_19320 [Paenibacillus sp. J31TS4]
MIKSVRPKLIYNCLYCDWQTVTSKQMDGTCCPKCNGPIAPTGVIREES